MEQEYDNIVVVNVGKEDIEVYSNLSPYMVKKLDIDELEEKHNGFI